MGGVDLADKKRKHCDSTVMHQRRWWLKIFFYMIDVTAANALVLYNEAMESRGSPKVPISEFKQKLIKYFTGNRLEDVDRPLQSLVVGHTLQKTDGKVHSCAFCALVNPKKRVRTRYCCILCAIPLCAPGNGINCNSCFDLCHTSTEMIKAVKRRSDTMDSRTPDKFKRPKVSL